MRRRRSQDTPEPTPLKRPEREERRMSVEVGTAQWRGTRPTQNDVISVLTLGDGRGICVMVADGIGTDAGAGRAAQTAIQAMQQAYSSLQPGGDPVTRPIRIVGSAHRAVLKLNAQMLDQGMMSTGAAVGCILAREENLSFCSVGNVRIFLWRRGAMLQLNRDFLLSTSAETETVLEGTPNPAIEPDWNLRLTAYAGMDGLRDLDWPGQELTLLPGDQIIMMSSGLFGVFTEEEWSRILETYSPQEAAEEAVARVKERRMESQSNVSLAVLRFV